MEFLFLKKKKKVENVLKHMSWEVQLLRYTSLLTLTYVNIVNCHDDNEFLRLQQNLLETGSVNKTALVNAGHPRTLWTPANKDTVTAAMERKLWKSSSDIAREWGLANQGSSKYYLTINGIIQHIAESTSISRGSFSAFNLSGRLRFPGFDHLVPCAF